MTEPSDFSPEPVQQEPARVPVTVRFPARKPTVTYVLIGVTILIYVMQYLSQRLTGGVIDWPFLLGGKINELILRGQVWRLITPVLLHGNLIHIAFNMYALYSLGSSIERYYGHWKFLLLYFIGGFAGNTFSFLLTENPSLGASTAVFGLVAAEAVFIYKNRKLFGPQARTMLINSAFIVVVNLILGMRGGIDNWGHLGGLFGGAIFAWVSGPVLKIQATIRGYEMINSRTKLDIIWGFLLSAGLCVAIIIGRFLAAR